MICVTSSHILHGPKFQSNIKNTVDYKAYYGMRNRILVLKHYGNSFTFFAYVQYIRLRNYAAEVQGKEESGADEKLC